ncbi:Hypothetical_protein [Hexamita inflata]|uniref:Hypothetical_protein n=1 Tax=Hexamita inflata TaxID=28002 RepID=A0AA86TLQ8_9EUKA|nr:Hypothetical protein HINF_LOCUS8805 [Hexamita inflata]
MRLLIFRFFWIKWQYETCYWCGNVIIAQFICNQNINKINILNEIQIVCQIWDSLSKVLKVFKYIQNNIRITKFWQTVGGKHVIWVEKSQQTKSYLMDQYIIKQSSDFSIIQYDQQVNGNVQTVIPMGVFDLLYVLNEIAVFTQAAYNLLELFKQNDILEVQIGHFYHSTPDLVLKNIDMNYYDIFLSQSSDIKQLLPRFNLYKKILSYFQMHYFTYIIILVRTKLEINNERANKGSTIWTHWAIQNRNNKWQSERHQGHTDRQQKPRFAKGRKRVFDSCAGQTI